MVTEQLAADPHNLEAEEHVLGAMMLAQSAIDRVVTAGLEAPDFYRESHSKIFRAALSLHQLAKPVDPITVSERLAELGQLDEIGGKDRVREIATLTPVAANVGVYAEIIIREARRRHLQTVGLTLVNRARESVDPDEIQAEAEQLLAREASRGAAAELQGLTHDEVLALHLDQERELISGLVPAGAVGTIAGVPETHKSWLAQAIAIRVARGNGWVLGREVTTQGPVGYFWQDDSTREEAERVKLFEQTHTNPSNLPVQWFLNEGVALPQDINRIRATVERLRLVLIVLDSFYNFLPGIDLKDETAEQVVALLKREISDATGCTVLIVDHMPWATEANRGRLRAYGGVFKNAATRFGIYIDAISDKLHIEARGNNITGFPKRLAYWDPDTLELKLAANDVSDDSTSSATKIADWINDQGGDVERMLVLAHFEISEDTLRRRLPRLHELGIDYIGGRHKTPRLVVRPPREDTPEQTTFDDLGTAPQEPQCGAAAPNDESPLNQAKPGTAPQNPQEDDARPKNTGFAGKTPEPQARTPYGGNPPAAVPPNGEPASTGNRLANHIAWINTTGYLLDPDALTVALLERGAGTNDLERLVQVADERAARELGG